jgi:hypothetical protein
MPVGHGLGNGQTQTAAGLRLARHAVEAVEHARPRLGRNPGAFVGDDDVHLARVAKKPHAHGGAFRRVLDGDVRMAHIRFVQHSVNGVVTAADVIGPAGQRIAAAEFAEVISAIRSGVAYANLHSSKFPGGEIRGQLRDDD